MRKLTLALLVLLAALPAWAQYTSVSGQVLDPSGTPFIGCTGNANFVNQSSLSQKPLLSGSTFQTTVLINCDSAGNLPTFRLVDNNQVVPTPSQWSFSLCTQDKLHCFTVLITITGATQNITAALQAAAPPIPPAVAWNAQGASVVTAIGTPAQAPAAGFFKAYVKTGVGFCTMNSAAVELCYGNASSGTPNQIAYFSATNVVSGNPRVTEDGATFAYSGANGYAATGSNGGLYGAESDGTGLTGASKCGAGQACFWLDSTTHTPKFLQNNGSADTVVGVNTAATLANKTLSGTTNYNRVHSGGGSAVVAGDFSLSAGWGSTATKPSVVGTDAAGALNITANGAGIGANPNVTFTFHDGSWGTTVFCTFTRGDGNAPVAVFTSATGTTSVGTFFAGTPVSGTTYTMFWTCQ